MTVLTCLLLLSVLHQGVSQTQQVCVYYDTVTSSLHGTTDLEVTVTLNSGAVKGTGLSTVVDSAIIDHVQFTSTLFTLGSPIIAFERSVKMIDSTAVPPLIMLRTTLTHMTGSSGTLFNVKFDEDITNGLQAFWSASFLPGANAAGLTRLGRTALYYDDPSSLSGGDNSTVQYEAEPSGDQGQALTEGHTDFVSLVSFNHSSTGDSFSSVALPVCLDAVYIWESSVFYRHGFTALTFFLALLLGFLLVALFVFLFFFIFRRRNKSSVSPDRSDENRIKESSKKIIMDPKAALRKGTNIIKDHSIMAWNESIVLILSQKDKLHMFREIDNLDVLATIQVDTDLEKEQNDAAVQTSFLLVQGLRHNGDISKQVEDGAVASFNSGLKDLDKKLEAEYKKELEVVYTDLSSKNKEKLSELLQKHRAQKNQAVAATKELPEKERQGLLELIEQQQRMEENELTFTLALEQNEGAEKLRKEFAIRKRMGIKEQQQSMLGEVVSKGQLQAEQAEWLMKEHRRQQEAVHRMYDEEISRQRMVLEEKLARRRALATASETQEDDQNEQLNLTAAHIVGFLQKGRKNSVLTANQSEEWIEEMKAKALAIKTERDSANDTVEKDLHKKLSQVKVSRLNELIKKHEAEIQEFVKKSKAQQTEGPVDPVSYAEGMLKLKSQHRVELTGLENELDAEHATQLAAARDTEGSGAKEKLEEMERDMIQKLQEEGMTNKVVETLMKKHTEESENLQAAQARNRRDQEDKLKEELARRRREWMNRREKERQEQEDLREHEAEVVEKLVSSQVSMSEAERDRIMKEHEKQMVLLENSLTLNKLRQQRALEERLNQKRAQQISKLQTQQQSEVNKHRKTAENNGEEDDEETHRETLELMKKHAQQRIAVMQGSELNIDEELDQIRIEMTKERALALKSQEERLGAMITALQMEKAREMTQIEEQQKAINSLKANLMDDLNERGILSTPECERILDVHKQESEAMNQRLETQRNKQENLLRSKLQERMQQREKLMLARHEAEMRSAIEAPGSKFGAKVRRAMLVHKHMVEMEKFRNRMDREISQSLAETKRQFEVLKLQKLQEQELSFVAGLVRVGCFQENELMDVLHMLFPKKTEEDIKQVFAMIMEGTHKPEDKDMPSKSTIVERVYQGLYVNPSILNTSASIRSLEGSRKKKQRRLAKKSSRSSMTYPGTAPRTLSERDYPQDAYQPDSSIGMMDRRDSRFGMTDRRDSRFGMTDRRDSRFSMTDRRDSRFGMTDRRDSAAHRTLNGYNNPAYSQDYYSDSHNQPGRRQRFNDDDTYDRDYHDDGTDYIGLGASMPHDSDGDRNTAAPAGRLPPLGQSGQPLKKKKKKGMLKKHRQHQQEVGDL
ncbi:limbin-like [Babylonia areolata]|uniref:limbin-like n=1 Tax=Babylonia areolata TaxID=304850 RepID=UPI003FCFED12